MPASFDKLSIPQKPWTEKSIKALRSAIIRGEDRVDELSYEDIYLWYSDILTDIVQRLEEIPISEEASQHLEPSFRVKTLTTLRDKLIRQDKTPIYRIHDIIGARISANISLSDQSLLAERILSCFPNGRIHDLRSNPHAGYRAVHVILHLPRGIFAEIQIRTTLQDLWANCFETAGDIFGRDIRYYESPAIDDPLRIVATLKESSSRVAYFENNISDKAWTPQQLSKIDIGIQGLSDTFVQLNAALERIRDAR